MTQKVTVIAGTLVNQVRGRTSGAAKTAIIVLLAIVAGTGRGTSRMP
jgi:hypothetical protein